MPYFRKRQGFFLQSTVVIFFLLTIGCAQITNVPGSVGVAGIFPHPPGWLEPDLLHGENYLTYGIDACNPCHQVSSPNPENPPTCQSCHKFPHPADWENTHGKTALEGISACATRCHGTDLKGGLTGVSCNDCHKGYPHPYTPLPGWKSGTVHGPVALSDIAGCKFCHGPDLDQVPAGYKSCKDCHPGWLEHDSAQRGSFNWNSTRHGSYVMSLPLIGNDADLTDCQQCHGTDFNGGVSTKDCKGCHSGDHDSYPYLHTASNWGTRDGHGQFVTTTLPVNLGPCTLCHGADYTGGNSNVSCYSCHPDFPHGSGWAAGSGHGVFFSTDYNSTTANSATCKNCHSQPDYGPIALTFTDTDTKNLLNSQSDCYKCHWAYPHNQYHAIRTPVTDEWIEEWEPIPPNNMAHVLDLIRSPLVVDAMENHPPSITSFDLSPLNDPLWTSAIQNTCGGSGGLCHSAGNRTSNTRVHTLACQFCHVATSGSFVHPSGDASSHCLYCHAAH